MMFLIIFASILFLGYLTWISIEWNVPSSISESYYLIEEKWHGKGRLFTIWCWLVSFSIIPLSLEISNGKWFQFMAFLCSAGLAFVGTAPLFKSYEKIIHRTSAIICAASALAWSCLLGHELIFGFFVLVAIFLMLCNYKFFTPRTIYLGEMVCFLTMYISIIIELAAKRLVQVMLG
jgi:hypothetical protein